MAVQKEIEELREQSLAMEMLKDSKRANKRMAIAFTSVLIIISILWFATICYLVYILNDIGIEQTTTETYEMNADGSNNFINGDNNGEIKN